MVRALIVAEVDEELDLLARAAFRLFGSTAEYLALTVSSDSVDQGLAWGTTTPVVRSIPPPSRSLALLTARDGVPAQPSADASEIAELPLAEDGDTATAILDAAHRFAVDVVVAAGRDEAWVNRFFAGSATGDLLRAADVPVLVVNTRLAEPTP